MAKHSRTAKLDGGGTVDVTVDADLFKLTKRQRDSLFEIVDALEDLDAGGQLERQAARLYPDSEALVDRKANEE